MLAGDDLVAGRHDQLVDVAGEPLGRMVGVRRGLLQDGIGRDHLARHQVVTDAEILQRALGLRAPELVGGNVDLAETVGFLADIAHGRCSRGIDVDPGGNLMMSPER